MLQDRQTEQTNSPTTTTTPVIEPKSNSTKSALKGMTYDQGAAALAPGGSIQKKTDPSNTYDVTGAEGTKAVGAGKGNRPGDVLNDEGKVENATIEAKNMGSIPAPDLKEIPTLHETKAEGKYGSYAGTTVKGGTYGKVTKDVTVAGKGDADADKVKKAAGKGDYVGAAQNLVGIKGPSVEGQAGYSANAIAGMKGEKTGKYGKVEGDIHAQADAYVGASGNAGISEKGAVAEGKAGLGVSAGIAGEAAYTTPGIKIEGVEKELTAGAKVEGSAEVYAKAGVEGGAYLTKDMIGLKGSAKAGAGVKAEAKGTLHMGPVSVTGKASGIAGAEASAEGSFYYADGKIHVGGSLSAALGLGGELGLEVVIDVKQSWELAVKAAEKAKELGIKGYKAVYSALDHDGDGKISAQDFAAHGADGMRKGAKVVDKGVDKLISAMDQDGDGKFTLKGDGAAAAGKAWDATKDAASKAKEKIGDGVDYAKEKGKQGIDYVKKKGKQAHDALDQDGDGKLGANDVRVGAKKVANKTVEIGQKAWTGAKSMYNQGVEGTKAGWAKAQQWYGSAKSTADRNGDGKLDWQDVVSGAKEVKHQLGEGAQWAKEKAKAGANYAKDKAKSGWDYISGKGSTAFGWLKSKGTAAKDAVHGFLDQNNDGKLSLADARQGIEKAAQFGKEKAGQAMQAISETYHSTVQHAQEAYQSAKAKLDVNGDGKIDSADAKAAAKAAGEQLKSSYHATVTKAKELYSDAKKTVNAAVEKAKEVSQNLKGKLDANGDGKLGVDDLKLGAKNAWNRTKETASKVKEGATKAWESASETFSSCSTTLKSGYNDAKTTVKGSWNKLTSFFGY